MFSFNINFKHIHSYCQKSAIRQIPFANQRQFEPQIFTNLASKQIPKTEHVCNNHKRFEGNLKLDFNSVEDKNKKILYLSSNQNLKYTDFNQFIIDR